MKKKTAILLTVVLAFAAALYLLLPGLLVERAGVKERGAAGLAEKSLRIDDHEIVYLEGGQGEPVLMLHGFAGNKDNWTRFAKFVTPTHLVVALDLPGFGKSTYAEEGSYSMSDQAQRLDRFTDALGFKKFHVVGNSMGGHISARYAIMFPGKVLSVGLFNTAGVMSPVPSELFRRLLRGERNPLLVTSAEDFDELVKFLFVQPPDIPWVVKGYLVQEALHHKASNSRIFKQISGEVGALEPDLGKINARTLVLWGDSDRVLDVTSVQVLEKGLPRCTSIIMKECGHVPMIERPEETAGHYLTFLKGR
jgi:pimeloyl-ACP methyl ester carboxylesterase